MFFHSKNNCISICRDGSLNFSNIIDIYNPRKYRKQIRVFSKGNLFYFNYMKIHNINGPVFHVVGKSFRYFLMDKEFQKEEWEIERLTFKEIENA